MDVGHWIIARELGADRSWSQAGATAPLDRPVVVGREGELAVGVVPEDPGVSRVAITATATREGWRIDRTNRNGAVIHPWGLAPIFAAPHTLLDWPLIAIRITGSMPNHQHWVLLESRPMAMAAGGATKPSSAATARSEPPKPLTPAELEAIWTVFTDVLAWPPIVNPLPLQLKQAARRLRISESGVQFRLNGAHKKAMALGLTRPVRLTEPEYLNVLIGAGYVKPPQLSPLLTAFSTS